MKIATVGLWHLGAIYSVCLASLGNKVFAITDNVDFGEKLEKGETDLFEPSLINLLKKNKKLGLVKFTTDFKIIQTCDVIWITIDTPTDKNNLPDTSGLLRTLGNIIPNLKQNTTIVVSSQLPVGT